MAAARAGDRESLDRLLRLHYDRIYGVARRLMGNEADALDATQEALIAVVRGIARYDGRAGFGTWAYRVATNACLDQLRSRARRPVTGMADEHGLRPHRDDTPDLDESVANRLDIEAALAALSPDLRAAVVLRDQLGMDYADIAATLGIPGGTVRSRIARGRARLADSLGGNPVAPPERPTNTP